MSETTKTIANEAIVLRDEVADIEKEFGVTQVSCTYEPIKRALVRAAPDSPPLVRRLRDAGRAADHNYVLAAMTHAQFFPISFPRPGPAGTLVDAEKSSVRIVAIDSAVLYGSPLDAVTVEGSKQSLKDPADTTSAEVHGTLVAGVLAQLEPRATIEVAAAADPNNDNMVSDYELACQLLALANRETPPDIVNLSLGASALVEHPVASSAALDELMGAGVTVFAAVGNDGLAEIAYPANYPGVLSVGGQARSKGRRRKADFSNASDDVDLWAPAVDIAAPIVATRLTFRPVPDEHRDRFAMFKDLPPSVANPAPFSTGWARVDGTSFAAPQMAACMASRLIDGQSKSDALDQLRQAFGRKDNEAGCGEYAAA